MTGLPDCLLLGRRGPFEYRQSRGLQQLRGIGGLTFEHQAEWQYHRLRTTAGHVRRERTAWNMKYTADASKRKPKLRT